MKFSLSVVSIVAIPLFATFPSVSIGIKGVVGESGIIQSRVSGEKHDLMMVV